MYYHPKKLIPILEHVLELGYLLLNPDPLLVDFNFIIDPLIVAFFLLALLWRLNALITAHGELQDRWNFLGPDKHSLLTFGR